MPKYLYQATKQNGEAVSGEIDAAGYDEVYQQLSQKSLIPINIQQNVDFDVDGILKKMNSIEIGDVSLNDKVMFSRQLATMMAAGLPITQAIEILLEQTKSTKVRKKLSEVYKDVQSGQTLSMAFGKQKLFFSELQLSLIEAGEKSGNLVEIMTQIADDMKTSALLKGKIKGAMIYPIVIFLVIILVVVIMMVVMVPAIAKLYDDYKKPLPEITQFMVNISNALSNPFVLFLIATVLIAGFFSFKAFYRSKGGKSTIDKLLLVIPIFGELMVKSAVYEMSRLMQMLFKSGIPIIDALRATAKSLGNYHFRAALEEAAVEVSKGVPLAVPLSRSRVIPLIVVKLIATGEQTGKLDQILGEITSYYGDQVEEMTSNLTRLMEPIILVVVGVIVAFLALAIYVPIYNLGNVVE